MDKNNILFVGNGIDLLNGYKTDYVSFLMDEKKEYEKLFIQAVKKKLGSKVFFNRTELKEKDVNVNGFIEKLFFEKDINNLKMEFANINIYDRCEYENGRHNNRTMSKEMEGNFFDEFESKLELSLENEFFSVSAMKEEDIRTNEVSNLWISYFIKCYLDGILSGENWIDLEGLIFENAKKIITDNEKTQYTIKEHKEMYFDENCDIYEEFINMKERLCIYLSRAKINPGDLSKLRCDDLDKYGTILNFNYSSSDLLPQVIPGTEEAIDEFFIHGTTYDRSDIVFGFDDGMLTNVNTNEYEYQDSELYKMSKTYQLLKLSLKYQSDKMVSKIKIPDKENINCIGILGHSISQADYNYFSTLCDFDKVTIEIFWYDYYVKDNSGKRIRKNNQIPLMESLIAMIHEMERKTKIKILHRMLIEQRIVFRKVNY